MVNDYCDFNQKKKKKRVWLRYPYLINDTRASNSTDNCKTSRIGIGTAMECLSGWYHVYSLGIRCLRFYRYTIELIDRFFLDASLMTAILPVERLVSNRLYIETWVIPRHWNKWRLQHWFNTGRVIIRAQAKEETRSKSISGNYPRARIWIRCYFPPMKYDHRRYFTSQARCLCL